MIKKIIILVVALGLLVFLVTKKKNAVIEKTQGTSFVFYNLKDKVKSLKFIVGNDSTVLSSSGTLWNTEDNDFPADTSKVNALTKIIYEMEDKEIVSNNPERASEYGLDSNSRKTIALLGDGGNELARFHVGKVSGADYSSTYWKKADKDEVYRTAGNFTYQIKAKADEWKDKKLFHFSKDDIQQMDISWKDSTDKATSFSIVAKGDGNWGTSFPEMGNAKKAPVETLAGRFGQLQIDGFAGEGDSIAISLGENPDLDIRVSLKDGSSKEIKAKKDSSHYYMKHPNREEVVKLAKWRLSVFEKQFKDIFEPDTASAMETSSDSSKN